MNLNIQIGNKIFANPVWVASGTFGFGLEMQNITDISRIGAVVTPSITLEEQEGPPMPRTVETAAGLLSHTGFVNPGIKKFIHDILPLYRNFPSDVIVSLAGNANGNYSDLIEKLEESEIAGFEIYTGEAYHRPSQMQSLVGTLRKITARPLIIKLLPDYYQIDEIARAAEGAGADALTVADGFPGMAVDIRYKKSKLSAETGRLSGAAVKPLALALVRKVYEAVKIPVVGCGGISSLNDALEFFISGATAIQVGTANFINPATPVKISNELEKFILKNNHQIKDITGTLKTDTGK